MHECEATKPQQNTANPQPFCIFCIIWDLMKHQKLRLVCNSFTYSVLSGEPRHLKKIVLLRKRFAYSVLAGKA